MHLEIFFFTVYVWIFNFLGSIFLGAHTTSISYAKKHSCLMLYGMIKLPKLLQFLLFANWMDRKTNIYNTIGQISCYVILLSTVTFQIIRLSNVFIVLFHRYALIAIFLLTLLSIVIDAAVYILKNGDY